MKLLLEYKELKMESLETFDTEAWDTTFSEEIKQRAIQALEGGKVLYFPHLPFILNKDEKCFLSPQIADPKTKNISYDSNRDRLAGTVCSEGEANKIKAFLKRYARKSRGFLENLIPHYTPNLVQAKTSFRPVEISGRKSSYRKDDTLLHVDSFPSNPTKGKRILRVFTNINAEGKSRIWRVGEPFEEVVKKMAPKVSLPFPGAAYLLKALGITKDYRTHYDHYMLQMHNLMKGDANYQKNVFQQEIAFPPGSTWIVYTDQVSHAAMSGQHVLEQTFHLPYGAMQDESTNPIKVLEKYLQKSLL
jgi:hypothetical protein